MSDEQQQEQPAAKPVRFTITHDDAAHDKALKLIKQGPQGAPVISFLEPGESAQVEVSDCNELHVVEWNATPKAADEQEA